MSFICSNFADGFVCLLCDQFVLYSLVGVSVGMGMPDLQEVYEAGHALHTKGARAISPFFMPRNLVNMASGHISIETGFKVMPGARVMECGAAFVRFMPLCISVTALYSLCQINWKQ